MTGAEAAKPIPILFVNYHGFVGGGQVLLLTLLDGLDRARFTPHVVCCQDGPFLELLRARGLKPILIPFGRGKLRYLHASLPAIWNIFRLIRRLKIRVVHVSGLQEAKLAAWAAALRRVPLVWVVAP